MLHTVVSVTLDDHRALDHIVDLELCASILHFETFTVSDSQLNTFNSCCGTILKERILKQTHL